MDTQTPLPCATCGYPLADTPNCPECGRPTAESLAAAEYRTRLRTELPAAERTNNRFLIAASILTILTPLASAGFKLLFHWGYPIAILIGGFFAIAFCLLGGVLGVGLAAGRGTAPFHHEERSIWMRHARWAHAGWLAFTPLTILYIIARSGPFQPILEARTAFRLFTAILWFCGALTAVTVWCIRSQRDRKHAGLLASRWWSCSGAAVCFIVNSVIGFTLWLFCIAAALD